MEKKKKTCLKLSFRAASRKIFRNTTDEGVGQALRTPKEEIKMFIFRRDLKQVSSKGSKPNGYSCVSTPQDSMKIGVPC